MPGYYVFPGGRLDQADGQWSGFAEDLPRQPKGHDWATHRKRLSLARAAIRETFEETGILVGQKGYPLGPAPKREIWQAFVSAGCAPAFARLRLFARAVTPVSSPMRFNTRFFYALDCPLVGQPKGNGELEDLHWRPVREVLRLQLAQVSALVLREALTHVRIGEKLRRRAPLFFWTRPESKARFTLARPGEIP